MAKVGRTYIGIKGTSAETIARGFGTQLAKRAILRPQIEQLEATELFQNENFAQEEEGRSYLGTPVYGTMEIEKPKYSEFVFNKKTNEYEEKEVVLPSTSDVNTDEGNIIDVLKIEGCVLEVTQNRNIVTTSISGQDGTDKEFINNGDYSVKLNGFLSTTSPDIYPEIEVKILKAYLEAPVPLKINNTFLNDYFGVNTLVVMKSEFKQVKGMRNVQYFTVDFISDIAFETLEIDNV